MQPKNMLFIMSDEHQGAAMGCQGHPLVKTPNMDRLAANGVRFDSAYSSCAICVPTRAAFATGRYVHDIGNWCNGHPYTGAVKGWGHRLQQNGHRVVSIGKLHYRNATDDTGFDEQIEPMHVVNGIGDVAGAVRDSLPVKANCKKMSDQIGPGESPYTEYDRKIVDNTVSWLKNEAPKYSDKPWCIFVSFVCPHFPLIAPPEFYEMYPLENIPLPDPHPHRGYVRHPWIEAAAQCAIYDQFFTDETRKIAIASYYGLTSFLDDNIGKVIKALDDSGLSDDTRVVYTSDHGDNLGTRGLWGKSNMYEPSANIPMIISGPGVPQGEVCNTPVTHVDCYQTILDCVGLPLDDTDNSLPGTSIYEIAANGDDKTRVGFSEYHASSAKTGSFMLRRDNYKYIYYVEMEPELFDLDSDPMELNDLSKAPQHHALMREFETLLRDIVDPEEVDRRAKADQAALVAKHGGRDAVLKRGSFGGTPAPGYKAEFKSGAD